MERLTEWTGESWIGRQERINGKHVTDRDIYTKLAEYEDLRMTPNEIKSFLRDFGISLAIENRKLNKRFKSVKIRMVNQFDGSCPSCGELLIMGKRKYRYCNVCGQKIDWD
ncbi:MAG TPA: hypothetical protein GXZ90_00400 [Clostridiales bacterium]|nr:hypothetical protein [Clostridiales bacterium]